MRRVLVLMGLGLAVSACGNTAHPAPVSSSPVSAAASPTAHPTGDFVSPNWVGKPSPLATNHGASKQYPGVLTLASPVDGQHVRGSLRAAGTSNSPEANTPWTLSDASGRVVRRGFFTADGWMDKAYPYRGTVSLAGLPAGTYVFTVSIDNPTKEGKPAPRLSRTIHVD